MNRSPLLQTNNKKIKSGTINSSGSGVQPPTLLLPMPSLVSSKEPGASSSTSNLVKVPLPQGSDNSSATSTTATSVPTRHLRSQSSVNLSSAMKEARDGQYRHTRMASFSRPDSNWLFDMNPPPVTHRQNNAGGNGPTSGNGVSSNSGINNSSVANGLGNGASGSSSVGNGGDLLAPPHMTFLSTRRGKRHNVDAYMTTAATSAGTTIHSRGSSPSLRGSNTSDGGCYIFGSHSTSSPAGPSSVSSSTTSSSSSSKINLLARKVTMHTGVSDLKAHVSSTLTSNITDIEFGLKQQLERFSNTLADLQALKSECGTLVAAFVAQTETAESDTQNRLKELKDEMANFSSLDGLEVRIRKAHATIDDRKARLDELGVWVEAREVEKRVWRERVTTARRALVYSLLTFALLFFVLRNFGCISSFIADKIAWRHDNTQLSILKGLESIDNGKNTYLQRTDLPLEDIVSCLGDIEHCQ